MRILTTIAVIAALLSGISVTNAQNAPTSKMAPSPSSINNGDKPTTPSGSEDQSAATGKPKHVVGRAKYCKETSANGALDCFYASMDACKKHNKSNSLQCVTNPSRGT
jgi:hypothetical protein